MAIRAIRALRNVQRWAADTKLADGRRVIDRGWVRGRLAQTHTKLDAMKLLNWQMVGAVQEGTLTPQDASAVKVYGSEARRDAYAWLMEIVGSAGSLKEGSAGAVLHGELERGYRSAVIFSFGGGNNEIQREIISWIGLGCRGYGAEVLVTRIVTAHHFNAGGSGCGQGFGVVA